MSHDQLDAVVDQVTKLLNAQIGLRPEPTLRGRLRRCIRDEAAATGTELTTYAGTLTQPDALQRLLNRITVQETSFFRHLEHFEVLARDVLPHLSQPVTIWSAGCANGQEAYSLAMVLEEQGIAGNVIASDLSTAALNRTDAGRYAPREVSGLSPARLARHMTHSGKGWQVNDAIRNRVSTMRHNLVDPLPDRVRPAQVVFCRNVLIYLSPDHTRAFLDQVADALPRGGYLFLGSAESIWPVSDRFETVRVDETFIYRRRTAPAPAPARVPGSVLGPLPVPVPVPVRPVEQPPARLARRAVRAHRPALTAVSVKAESPNGLARDGQQALNAGDTQLAIVAFRKWAYLAPDDAIAHLHLGLALEAAGDQPSAQRAFGAARRALLHGEQ
ncbi:MAG TPA: CheR family methyltransferase, partial [Jatrophihabitantaceae bacterium]|nr:CheR family methyltransferase [Jatrophihabitantaceae bacterium]